MAGFFRKVAGAFVEFPDIPTKPGTADLPSSDDVSALLEQLGASSVPGLPEPRPSGSASAPGEARRGRNEPPPIPPEKAQGPAVDALTVGPEAVFEQVGITDNPNSALRLMKILQGLAMFPPEQQLAMVRALDAADASWDEGSVLADARARQSALRGHLEGVEAEHARRQAAIAERAREAQSKGDEMLADIDRQIAELQALRQEALTETAKEVSALDTERREVDLARERARTAVADMSAKLSDLIGFFAGKRPGPHGA